MDISYKNNDFVFNLRTSAIIYDYTKSKILLFKINKYDFYLLVGGRIKEFETSFDAIKREVFEELNINISDFKYITTSEEFVIKNNIRYHQINIIYETTINLATEKLINKMNNKNEFNWIDVDELDNFKIYPTQIKDIMLNIFNKNNTVIEKN